MKINILAFGIAKDIVNGKKLQLIVNNDLTLGELKKELCTIYPDFKKLASLNLAVNEEYQDDNFVVSENDEIVIIPPVSGG